jgi:D-3-phosphoglycerate dehydrogenase
LKIGKWKKQMGSLLQGKTLGIIGLGSIGKVLVQLSSGFHFKILAFDQHEDELFAKENDVAYCDLETLLKNSDFVSIHLNLSDGVKYLINKDNIKLMKRSAILINTSRGEILDEKVLYDALISNHLAGAGLDVFEQEPYSGPLSELNNVILTPHIGSYAREIRIQMEKEATKNLIRGLNEAK